MMLAVSACPLVYAVDAGSSPGASTAYRYAPSASVRSALINDDRERFPYPGDATVNAVQLHFDDLVVRLLSDPARRRSEGPDALLAAIQLHDSDAVLLILGMGVDPNAVHGGGVAVLSYAATGSDNRILCSLADYGIDFTPGAAPHQPMLAALTSKNLDAAQLLAALGYVPGDDERRRLQMLGQKRGQTTLWNAMLAMRKDTAVAEALCRRIQAVPAEPTRIYP